MLKKSVKILSHSCWPPQNWSRMFRIWSRLRTDLKSFDDLPPIVVPSILQKVENFQYMANLQAISKQNKCSARTDCVILFNRFKMLKMCFVFPWKMCLIRKVKVLYASSNRRKITKKNSKNITKKNIVPKP
jgi:hypothetical protein